jgi:hypothetical protein
MASARGSASRLWWQLGREALVPAAEGAARRGTAANIQVSSNSGGPLGAATASASAATPSRWTATAAATHHASAAACSALPRPTQTSGPAHHRTHAPPLPLGIPLLLPAGSHARGLLHESSSSFSSSFSSGSGTRRYSSPGRRWASLFGGRFVRSFSRDAEMGDDVEGLAAQLGSFTRQGISRQGTPTFEVRSTPRRASRQAAPAGCTHPVLPPCSARQPRPIPLAVWRAPACSAAEPEDPHPPPPDHLGPTRPPAAAAPPPPSPPPHTHPHPQTHLPLQVFEFYPDKEVMQSRRQRSAEELGLEARDVSLFRCAARHCGAAAGREGRGAGRLAPPPPERSPRGAPAGAPGGGGGRRSRRRAALPPPRRAGGTTSWRRSAPPSRRATAWCWCAPRWRAP